MGKFDNKVVIITGSSAGIGQDAAIEFGKEGASLVIHGQNETRLNNTESALHKIGVPAERILLVIGSLDKPETPQKIIDSTIEKFEKIDVLINNAGATANPNHINDPDSLDNLDFIYKINLRSVIELTQLAYPYLEKTHGNVINVSSICAQKPFAQGTFYCSLKAALEHFTRCYAQIYGPKGVRINCLSPGPIQTYILERHNLDNDKLDKWSFDNTALKRIGIVAETSSVLKFLASDEASYVTGAIWLVDGGALVHTNNLDIF